MYSLVYVYSQNLSLYISEQADSTTVYLILVQNKKCKNNESKNAIQTNTHMYYNEIIMFIFY